MEVTNLVNGSNSESTRIGVGNLNKIVAGALVGAVGGFVVGGQIGALAGGFLGGIYELFSGPVLGNGRELQTQSISVVRESLRSILSEFDQLDIEETKQRLISFELGNDFNPDNFLLLIQQVGPQQLAEITENLNLEQFIQKVQELFLDQCSELPVTMTHFSRGCKNHVKSLRMPCDQKII